MLNSIFPTLYRLRTTNRQLQPPITDSNVYILQQQIELRSRVLRDMEVIQSCLRDLLNGQRRSVTVLRRRSTKRRRPRRPNRAAPHAR